MGDEEDVCKFEVGDEKDYNTLIGYFPIFTDIDEAIRKANNERLADFLTANSEGLFLYKQFVDETKREHDMTSIPDYLRTIRNNFVGYSINSNYRLNICARILCIARINALISNDGDINNFITKYKYKTKFDRISNFINKEREFINTYIKKFGITKKYTEFSILFLDIIMGCIEHNRIAGAPVPDDVDVPADVPDDAPDADDPGDAPISIYANYTYYNYIYMYIYRMGINTVVPFIEMFSTPMPAQMPDFFGNYSISADNYARFVNWFNTNIINIDKAAFIHAIKDL